MKNLSEQTVKRRQTAKSAVTELLKVDDMALAMTEAQADLLTKTKAYWFFAEWQLIEHLLTESAIKGHPEQGVLNLLLGTALLQLGKTERARSCVVTALASGLDKKIVSRMLLSCAHHTLANIRLLKDLPEQAEAGYAKALTLAGAREISVAANSRKLRALSGFGLFAQTVEQIDLALKTAQDLSRTDTAVLLAQLKSEQNRLKRMLSGQNSSIASDEGLSELAIADELVNECFAAEDIVEVLEAINATLVAEHLNADVKLNFCYLVSLRFVELKDNVMAVHFVNQALNWLQPSSGSLNLEKLSKLALELGQSELSIDLLIQARAASTALDDMEKKRLLDGYQNIRAASKQKQQHGHDLLLSHLMANPKLWQLNSRKRCLVEVGTTREHIPGQGSTMQLAQLCADAKIDFTTVDMDPNNVQLANAAFKRAGFSFIAVTQKGEDFLALYQGPLDFIFLDAYDFDHGKHSALRQSRYLKYLGETINEEQCYQMHLDCAVALLEKIAPDGLVCIDDTWQDENGLWTAKGTTAVPFLLNNGFEIIEARNRAVLMRRISE